MFNTVANANYYNLYNFGFKANNLKKFNSIDNSNYPQPIKDAMKRLTRCRVEHGLLFTQDGELLRETVGNKKSPFSNETQMKNFHELAEYYPGNILVHNHTERDSNGDVLPIQPADVWKTGRHDGSEAIAVHPDGTYSSVKCMLNEQKFSNKTLDDLSDYLTVIMSREYMIRFNNSGKERDEFWKEKAEEFGVIYTNTYDFGK